MPAPVDAGKDEVVPVRDEVGVEVDVAEAAERGKQPRARGWEVEVVLAAAAASRGAAARAGAMTAAVTAAASAAVTWAARAA